MASKKLKQKIAHFLFNRKMRGHKRNPRTVSFEKARSIGIVYDATEEKDYELVKNYVKEIRDQRKEVVALGYVDLLELPVMRFSKLGLDFFTRKDLTWYLKPNHHIVTKFTEQDFDILINLDTQKCFPVNYVSVLSNARFKIGKYDKKNSRFCDFLIKTDENTSLRQFIDHINHYIRFIGNVKAAE